MSRRGMVHSGEQRTRGALGAGVVAALLIVVPACSTSSPSTSTSTSASPSTSTSTSMASPPTSTPVTFQQGSAAEVADCGADAKSLEVALQTYMATQGAYPSPPSAWSAATYVANFGPLTSPQGSIGPSLQHAPATTFYVIEYDSSGHVWVAPRFVRDVVQPRAELRRQSRCLPGRRALTIESLHAHRLHVFR